MQLLWSIIEDGILYQLTMNHPFWGTIMTMETSIFLWFSHGFVG